MDYKINHSETPIPTIDWNINNECNYNCSYCYVFSENSGKRVSEREIKKYPDSQMFLNKFKKILEGNWEFIFGGTGEPFVAHNFLEIIKELVEMGHQIGVVTNFSLPLEKIIKFCEITNKNLTFLNASLHLEFADLDDFLKKAVTIKKIIGEKLQIVSVAKPGYVDKLEEIRKIFLNEGIRFFISMQRNYIKGEGRQYVQYDEKELEILRKSNRNFSEKSKVRFTGKMCWAGNKYLVVDSNGEVYRCNPARRCKVEKSLGNILAGTFKLNNGPAVCRYKYCDCITPITKNMIVG